MVAGLVAPLALVATAGDAALAADETTPVIVGFSAPPAVGVSRLDRSTVADVVRFRRKALAAAHQTFLRQAADAGAQLTSRGDFGTVYNGMALKVRQRDVAKLSRLPGVAGIYPDRPMHASADSGLAAVNVPAAWRTEDPAGDANTGAGEVVAVLDSGIDYTHPDLGGGLGPGHKVVGGYDVVNGDEDPIDDNGHGTHVAGIIAGKTATPDGRTGVAPDASLTAYKVLDSNGNGSESDIIEGLERAIDMDNPNRADVVNLSLSGPAGPGDPLSAACTAAVQAGIVVVAAAGNTGPGTGTVGSPAEAPGVLAVGASVSGLSVPDFKLVAPLNRPLHSTRLDNSANPPAQPTEMGVVDVGRGTAEDFAGTDVTGKAVLTAFGYNVSEVAALASQAGAAALLEYTPNYYSPAAVTPAGVQRFTAGAATDDSSLGIVAAVINGSDAHDIQTLLATGPVTVRLSGVDATDQIASFSSRGPAAGSYALKPDLVAPGVEIRSTMPGGGYQRMSGTSMAAPHVAGAAALVRQAHPDWSATQVQSALTSSAHQLSTVDANTVGAGRLDALAAVQATVLPSPRVADLGLADMAGPRVGASSTITLTNTGNDTETVTLHADPVPGPKAQMSVTPATVNIPAGGTRNITLRLSADQPAANVDFTGTITGDVAGAGPPARLEIPYLLAVRPMDLHATPDPTASTSTILLHAEPDLAGDPVVTVTDPHGNATKPAVTLDHSKWWRVPVQGGSPGTYRVEADARTPDGTTIVGGTTYQVLAPGQSQNWQSVGPNGGAEEIATAPSKPGRLYAYAQGACVFRSDDFGANWQEQCSVPVGHGAAAGLAVDPHDPQTVYLAVDGDGDPTYSGKVMVSHDAGATWTATAAPDAVLFGLAMDDSGTLLAANALTGAYLSRDGGESWQSVALPNGNTATSMAVVGTDVYLGTANGLYVVRDATGTPEPPRLILQPAGVTHYVLAVAGNGDELVAASLTQMLVSHDGGATWDVQLTLPPGTSTKSAQFIADDLYLTDSRNIWVRRAGETSLSTIASPVPGTATNQVAAWPGHPQPLLMVVGGVGVYRTDDQGKSYARIGVAGVNATQIAVTSSQDGSPMLAVASEHGNYVAALPTQDDVTSSTRDWGRNGVENAIGDTIQAMAAAPTQTNTVYRASYSGHFTWNVGRSTDGGATWTTVMNARVTGLGDQIAVSPTDPQRVYVSYHDSLGLGLLVSRDGGAHWSVVSEAHRFTAIAADPANPDALWLGGPDGLYRTTDAGQSLTLLQSTPVTAIAVDPHDPRHLVVGGASLNSSWDGGRTLVSATGDELRKQVSSLAIAPDGTVYAGAGEATDAAGLPMSGRGVLRSRDGGRHWDNMSAGLPDLDVRSLTTSPDGRWLFVGTGGGGVYRAATGR